MTLMIVGGSPGVLRRLVCSARSLLVPCFLGALSQ